MYQLFYAIYKWNKHFISKSEQPVLNSLTIVTFLIICNILTLSLVIEMFTSISLINFHTVSNLQIALFTIAIFVFNYFILVFKGKSRKIINIFDTYPQNISYGWVKFYILFSIVSLLLIFGLVMLKN